MATSTTTYTTFNGMLMSEDRDGVETFYTPDPLGNLLECRNSSGTKTYSAEYWPYGEVQTSSGTNPSPWGFIGLLGYLSDTATMLYVRARYLMTKWTRWLTVDPLWPDEPAYRYCHNSPSLVVDPSGLCAVTFEPGLEAILAALALALGISLSELLIVLGLAFAIVITWYAVCRGAEWLVHRICPDDRGGPANADHGACSFCDPCTSLIYKAAAWHACAAIRAFVTIQCGAILGFTQGTQKYINHLAQIADAERLALACDGIMLLKGCVPLP